MNKILVTEWAKEWHGDCDADTCDIKKALDNDVPFAELLTAIEETDDGFEESYETFVDRTRDQYSLLHTAKSLVAELRSVYGEGADWDEVLALEKAIDVEEANFLADKEENPL